MASGPLRFRTPYIEELPTTQTRQAPGFAWVAVAGPSADPAKNWGTTNRKRARNAGLGQTDSQKEALSARQQREIERKIRELNSDNVRGDGVAIPAAKKDGSGSVGGGQVKAGKTPNTKKILASGKTFAHYLDDEEAEIARTGKRDIEGDGPSTATATATVATTQRASKTPLARRKPPQEVSASASPAPTSSSAAPALQRQDIPALPAEDMDEDSVNDPLPTQAELDALINAPPLTYNQARSQPPPAGAPPPRKFCEICGYWGRVKCMKCGNMTCSVVCKDAHDENKCLKFYA